MLKNNLEDLVKSVDGQLFELVSHLICSICHDCLTKPVTTPCGHSFCNGCIRRVLMCKNNSGCPLCKTPVKRYDLQTDKVKSTLTEICQELPSAFSQDVIDLTSDADDLTNDIMKMSKLAQLNIQEDAKQSKSKRKKSIGNKNQKKQLETEANYPGSFVPVLRKSKNVLEYPSAKKKKMDDFVSISQTEAPSTSSFLGPNEVNKELQNIEKIQPEEKVKEWFEAVGDNIYVNSPNSFIGDFLPKETTPAKASMVRRDYSKLGISFSKENDTKSVTTPTADPYDFIPSQNNRGKTNRRKSRRKSKKMFDFEALQNFTKESVKRNSLLERAEKEEGEGKDVSVVEEILPKSPMAVTASQKFEKLLSETKESEKAKTPKVHTLYSASQASSLKFLDCSYNSKTDFERDIKISSKKKKLKESEDSDCVELFKGELTVVGGKKTRQRNSSKRKRSLDVRRGSERQKKLFFGDPKTPTEKNVSHETEPKIKHDVGSETNNPRTKLLGLLKELADEVSRPDYDEVEKGMIIDENKNSKMEKHKIENLSQVLYGFGTQEELVEEKRFKEMVSVMEKELNAEELEIEVGSETEKQVPDVSVTKTTLLKESPKETVQIEQKSENLVPFNLLGRIEKTRSTFIEFLQLGRLTPSVKRSKSSVVKLIFAIGLSSFAEKRALQNKCAVGVQTLQPVDGDVTTKEQTKMSSVDVQTSPRENHSVEIQTSQRETSCMEVQTSQWVTTCMEVQTSQFFPSQAINKSEDFDEPLIPEVEEKTTSENLFSSCSGDKVEKTPVRKPAFKHRKIVKKESPKSGSESFSIPPTPNRTKSPTPKEKEVLLDSEVEKEFESSWKTSERVEENKGGEESDDSDVQPPKTGRNLREIISQSSSSPAGVIEKFETRQKIPLEVRITPSEVVDLVTPSEGDSEELRMRVLRNIDMDLKKKDERNPAKGEKSEESDSDFFVEQTPPRPAHQRTLDPDSGNKTRKRIIDEKKIDVNVNSEGTDLIGDSIPKALTEAESFLMLSAPEKILPTPRKNVEAEKVTKHLEVTKPNENDQNEINATPKDKSEHAKKILESWKKSEGSQIKNPPVKKKLCVVATSVKNLDVVKKFAAKFKIEFSAKPTKDMTHLIVGLHENEDGELLPLCTPKLLFAMASKKWVVSEAWAEACLKKNAIVAEESFETPDPVGGDGCRNARLSTEPLFKKIDVHLLGNFQTISKEELANLIVSCGGTLVSNPEHFSLSSSKIRMIIADRDCLTMNEVELQEMYERYSTVILSRDVIIMSIQSYKLANFSPYLLHLASEEDMLSAGYPPSLVRSEEEGDDGLWDAAN